MTAVAAFAGTHGHGRDATQKASAASRLLRAYTAQVETLHRLRHGGSQFVRVEHVQVNEGGQALIGNVRIPCLTDAPDQGGCHMQTRCDESPDHGWPWAPDVMRALLCLMVGLLLYSRR